MLQRCEADEHARDDSERWTRLCQTSEPLVGRSLRIRLTGYVTMSNDFRQKARDCLARARQLLAAGDEASVRHACLELRFSIEYVTYDQMVAYLAELPDDTVRKWTPKQVIDALREVDPNAEKTVTLGVRMEEALGVPTGEMQVIGQDRRFTGKWANTNHNALGNFLHASTLEQIESGRVVPLSTMLAKATGVADEIAAVLESTVTRVNFGQFYELKCGDCGSMIKRRAGSFSEAGIVCRTATCGATYDIIAESGREVTFRMYMSEYICPNCRETHVIGRHRVKPGATIECPGCQGRAKVAMTLVPERPAGPAPEAASGPGGLWEWLNSWASSLLNLDWVPRWGRR